MALIMECISTAYFILLNGKPNDLILSIKGVKTYSKVTFFFLGILGSQKEKGRDLGIIHMLQIHFKSSLFHME
jgi:hypothetical protein